MVKVHHTGDFCRHIFLIASILSYLRQLVSTLGVGGFFISERVKYVTYM